MAWLIALVFLTLVPFLSHQNSIDYVTSCRERSSEALKPDLEVQCMRGLHFACGWTCLLSFMMLLLAALLEHACSVFFFYDAVNIYVIYS